MKVNLQFQLTFLGSCNCVRCFSDSLGFSKPCITFYIWQYVGSIVIDSLLTVQDIFICHKCFGLICFTALQHILGHFGRGQLT